MINSFAVIKPVNKAISKSFLQLTQLESLYNIQTIKKKDQFLIYTSVFSDLDKKISLNAISSEAEFHPNSVKINSIVDAEISLKVLDEKQKNIKKDLELIQRYEDLRNVSNTESEEDVDINLTQNSVVPNDSDVPIFCYNKQNQKRHTANCNKHCFYSIAELKFLTSLRLEDELANHDHPRKLIKKGQKYYSLNERRVELIEHYKIYHKKEY